MTLSKEEIIKGLKDAIEPEDFYNLYQKHFNDEVPYLAVRNPVDGVKKIVDAIVANKKLKDVKIRKGENDMWE